MGVAAIPLGVPLKGSITVPKGFYQGSCKTDFKGFLYGFRRFRVPPRVGLQLRIPLRVGVF